LIGIYQPFSNIQLIKELAEKKSYTVQHGYVAGVANTCAKHGCVKQAQAKHLAGYKAVNRCYFDIKDSVHVSPLYNTAMFAWLLNTSMLCARVVRRATYPC